MGPKVSLEAKYGSLGQEKTLLDTETIWDYKRGEVFGV